MKVENQSEETLNGDVIGPVMMKFLETHFKKDEKGRYLNENWKGTPTELLETLTQIAVIEKTPTDPASQWPKEPQPFTRRLNGLISALNKKGYEVVSKSGTPRKIIISPSIQTKLNVKAFHYSSIPRDQVAFCSNCNAPTARITVTYADAEPQSFCPECFNNAKSKAEADGINFVEDKQGGQVIALARHLDMNGELYGFMEKCGMSEALRRVGATQENCKNHSDNVFCNFGYSVCKSGACLKYEDREPLTESRPLDKGGNL